MTTLAKSRPTLSILDDFLSAALDLQADAESYGLRLSSPSFHDLPRSIFRLIDAPQEVYQLPDGTPFFCKTYRGVPLFCNEPEYDIPEFVVLPPPDLAPEPVQPERCHHPMSISCEFCDPRARARV